MRQRLSPGGWTALAAAFVVSATIIVTAPPAASGATGPTVRLVRPGLTQSGSPSDATGAMGTRRYVEVVNFQIGIFKAGTLRPVNSFGMSTISQGRSNRGDPQIQWDPATRRFYYASLVQGGLVVGFSKGAAPNAPGDFCGYLFDSPTADFPKLGGTSDFVLVTANEQDPTLGQFGRVYWLRRPKAGTLTSCPAPARGSSGVMRFGMTPARQIDPSTTGYLLAPGGFTRQNNVIWRYPVTPGKDGSPVFGAPTAIDVPAYQQASPILVPQPGTSTTVNVGTFFLTQVVQSWDPRLGRRELWTAHTVGGGTGAAIAWYEINPAGGVDQTGRVSDPARFLFYPTISPDRVWRSHTRHAHGANMVLEFSMGGTNTPLSIGMVSKRGTAPVSPIVTVATSPGAYECGATSCRWGDYSGSSPDPNAPLTGATGRVALTNTLTTAPIGGTSHWYTVNALTVP